MTLSETSDATGLSSSPGGVRARSVSRSAELLGGFVLVASAVLLLAGKPADPTPTCRLNPGALVFGIDTRLSLAARAGATCVLTLRIVATSIEGSDVLIPPRHGTAALGPRRLVHYRSNPAFRGADSFELAIRGRSPVHDGLEVVRVDVTVD